MRQEKQRRVNPVEWKYLERCPVRCHGNFVVDEKYICLRYLNLYRACVLLDRTDALQFVQVLKKCVSCTCFWRCYSPIVRSIIVIPTFARFVVRSRRSLANEPSRYFRYSCNIVYFDKSGFNICHAPPHSMLSSGLLVDSKSKQAKEKPCIAHVIKLVAAGEEQQNSFCCRDVDRDSSKNFPRRILNNQEASSILKS